MENFLLSSVLPPPFLDGWILLREDERRQFVPIAQDIYIDLHMHTHTPTQTCTRPKNEWEMEGKIGIKIERLRDRK